MDRRFRNQQESSKQTQTQIHTLTHTHTAAAAAAATTCPVNNFPRRPCFLQNTSAVHRPVPACWIDLNQH